MCQQCSDGERMYSVHSSGDPPPRLHTIASDLASYYNQSGKAIVSYGALRVLELKDQIEDRAKCMQLFIVTHSSVIMNRCR